MIRFLFLLTSVLIGTNPCLGADTSQEIRIHLSTESALSPIYLSSIESKSSSLQPSYLKELEKILEKDFQCNGKTTVMGKTKARDDLLASAPSSLATAYASRFFVQGNALHTQVFLLAQGKSLSLAEVPLTGSLAKDRQKIHQLSDLIHKALFQVEGVASHKILYAFQNKTTEGAWVSEIAECDADGENITLLTRENSYCVTPVAIAKKDLFLYVSYKAGQPKIFIASKTKGQGKKVVDIRGNQMLPAISRQKDKLAFICDASGRTDLFVQPIDPETGKTGTPAQLFSYPRSTQASPTFSPDGSKIAFVSDKDGATRIYILSSKPQSKRQTPLLITKKNRESSCPSWSPDGTKLVYSAKTDGIRQLWIYDFALQEEKQLTFGPGDKENPCFASNSLHIVFNSTDADQSNLYVVNLNQPNAIKITKGPGKKHYPVWAPN